MKKLLTIMLAMCLLASCSGSPEPASSGTPQSAHSVTPAIEAEPDTASLDDVFTREPRSGDVALKEAALIACWHGGRVLGAGYGRLYIFRADYKFVWQESGALGAERLKGLYGGWTVTENNELILTVTMKELLTGGEETEALGSMITQNDGGKLEYVSLETPEVITIPINIQFEPQYSGYEREHSLYMDFGEDVYWKFEEFENGFRIFANFEKALAADLRK
jgi:hypothetical protein